MDIVTNLYNITLLVVIFFAFTGWLVLFDIKINYGRLNNSFFGIYLQPQLAWFLFEVPNLIWAFYFLCVLDHQLSLGYLLFIIHYINRDIIYPLRLKTTTKVPLEITLSAFLYTTCNGYLQGYSNSFGLTSQYYPIGIVLFVVGMAINIYSDTILQNQKLKSNKQKVEENGKKNYARIDKFLFKYIGSPNYFGQVIEWIGYYLVCGSFESLIFACSTIMVLTPSAIVRNRWNQKNIKDYPLSRKAIFPFLL